MKKKSKKSIVKSLQATAEKLWKEYAFLRDGRECQVKKHFKSLVIAHTNIYQVDHCFSRNNKELFLDTANSTVVCSACNMLKGFNNKVVSLAIDDIVIRREGQATFDRLREVASRKGGFKNWTNIEWLDLQIRILTEMIAEQKAGGE